MSSETSHVKHLAKAKHTQKANTNATKTTKTNISGRGWRLLIRNKRVGGSGLALPGQKKLNINKNNAPLVF